MKTRLIQQPKTDPPFIPVTMEITFETQNELNGFYNMVNWEPMGSAMLKYGLALYNLRKTLQNKITITDWDDFIDSLDQS